MSVIHKSNFSLHPELNREIRASELQMIHLAPESPAAQPYVLGACKMFQLQINLPNSCSLRRSLESVTRNSQWK